ncbi:hypothetical protein MHY01S_06920 [Meiothermus hypogaeus NBRC 106114]|uniref:Uncharacterized protein n=1 Tax=Meiothermus hypogaeus NBRC 106114 TaxID=1227553 RepID=A0A511R0L3_9DEIN|nr:hypothetical protein MHY01S_06920 [Meiothermus hypogaeus NBRC 106114]
MGMWLPAISFHSGTLLRYLGRTRWGLLERGRSFFPNYPGVIFSFQVAAWLAPSQARFVVAEGVLVPGPLHRVQRVLYFTAGNRLT